MSWFTGVLVYLVIWWIVFFMALPWGVQPPERPEEGHAESAPKNPMLLRKALATTAIAAVVFAVIYYVVDAGLIHFETPTPEDVE